MPVPTLELTDSPAVDSDAGAVLLAARRTGDGPELLAPDGFEWVAAALTAFGAKGAAEEITRLVEPGERGRVVIVAGVGDEADAATLRLAAGAAVRTIPSLDAVAIAVPTSEPEPAAALLEGAALGAYAFTEYRDGPSGPGRIVLHTEHAADAIRLDRIRAVIAAVARTKDLVNTAPNDLPPAALAELAAEAASAAGIAVRVLDERLLADEGFNGILAVGSGSSRPPRLVRLEYAPAEASVHLALVGKGITFDSGGLSLKPGASMVGMKSDMAGAAAVLSAIVALAELRVPVRVTGWLCLAENMPSSHAVRPNDVLRMKDGTTVEVLNTDAEGRLVMADALAAASAEQPDAIVDVATLTGAQVVALGNRIAGLMGDDDLVAQVRSAADAVGEPIWPMPLPDDLKALLKSDVADLANTKLGTVVPGMLLAGVFLQHFVGRRDEADEARIPWAHVDIAGPSFNSGSPWGFTGSGATGAAVRTLVRLGEQLAAK
ncbi:leucyl aminopeptidase [Agromyces flavus]|uniref:Probable cytosol aminopeptidase n=1 Tax=Agromyces flavus TaxID=589382 RepID=A0A1H1RQT9_9MICO|nr:leucyl aminopeptidase [Agromyces flavus]MCP2368864.1 leucyl aminopeptidase [Agromyces flavus]GGI48321.1 putative cytosol aminopeptidase [Agromyces flavus]SDS38033.1 leucyl aminopeptidase [Agromyces flavus]